MNKTAKELKGPPDTGALAIAKKQAPKNRIVKTVAVGKDLIAVAYWGGTVQVVDADGQVRTAQLLPHDVTSIASLDGNLVVGLSDGEVVALGMQ